jgi:hypothetical protein
VPGDEDDGGGGRGVVHDLGQLHARLPREQEVGEEQVIGTRGEAVQRVLGGGGGVDLVAVVAQDGGQRRHGLGIVVHHQHLLGSGGHPIFGGGGEGLGIGHGPLCNRFAHRRKPNMHM